MNYSYTDLEETNGLPLSQSWEKVAVKELSDIFNYLTHGLFSSPTDFANRLRLTAHQIVEYQPPQLPPPPDPHPSPFNDQAVAIGIAVYLNAVEIAAETLGVPLTTLIRYGEAKVQNQTDEQITQLCERVLDAVRTPYGETTPPTQDAAILQSIREFD